MLRDRSSGDLGAPWHRARLWWPVERVPVVMHIVHPRRLTALEWVVLRVVDAFRDAPPALRDVARELGIEDPGFLEDALRATVRLRALAPRSADAPAQPLDLPDLDFTPAGYALFGRGQIEGEPAEHGATVYFDALTDEAMAAPQDLRAATREPFPRSRPVAEPRAAVGLGRVRDIVRRFHADLIRGDGEVRDVEPATAELPSVQWRPVTVDCRLDGDGRLALHAPGLSQRALDYLRACHPIEDAVLPARPVSSSWPASPGARCSTRMTFEDWRARTAETVPVADVPAAVRRYVGQARTELVVQASWLGVDGLERDLAGAIRRGVRVLVVGAAAAEVFAWSDSPRPALGVRAGGAGDAPGALVADGRSGLLLDDVRVHHGDRELVLELAGSITADAASRLRDALVATAFERLPAARQVRPVSVTVAAPGEDLADLEREAAGALADPQLRVALARVAFLHDEDSWRQVVQFAHRACPGLARIVLLRRLRDLVRGLAPSLDGDTLEEPVVAAWRQGLRAVCHAQTFPASALGAIAATAPDAIEPAALVEAAIAAWVRPVTAARDPTPLERLLAIAAATDRRWGPGTASQLAAWRDARDACLRVEEWTGDAVAAVVRAARDALDRPELEAWASGLVHALPDPGSVSGLGLWIQRALPLRDASPRAFHERASELWRRLLRAHPADRERLLTCAVQVIDAEVLGEMLIAPESTAAQVDDLWRELRRVGHSLDAGWWRRALERTLPAPSALSTTAQAADLIALLARAGDDWQDLAIVGRGWARQVAANVPAPSEPAGFTWWLGELAPLRPLLGEELANRAIECARRFAASLREARARGDSEWREVVRSCAALGVSEAALEAASEAEGPDRARRRRPGAKPKAKHKNRKKRR